MSEAIKVPMVCVDCGGTMTDDDAIWSPGIGVLTHINYSQCLSSLDERLTAATERAEAAEAERDVARRETSQLVQDACEGAMVPVSLLDNVKHALHEVDPYNPALLGYAPSFGVWETLMRERDAAREEARENYEDCTVNIALLEKSISERDALRKVYKAAEVFVNMPRLVTESALRDAVTTFRALAVQP